MVVTKIRVLPGSRQDRIQFVLSPLQEYRLGRANVPILRRLIAQLQNAQLSESCIGRAMLTALMAAQSAAIKSLRNWPRKIFAAHKQIKRTVCCSRIRKNSDTCPCDVPNSYESGYEGVRKPG